ncbi:GspE/PulE family protein [Xanthomonas perforans]|uniref:GspE/PulE family protein n=1 Tax=Xanthomonas perforans TaxID=442694 RepID=UPI00235A1BC4|nr:ATPase, T2SS/T4P/T4SS family [Xanthomonas perforans]MDC9654338.1 ATPase, T2SS/T4P/T4SS family [Xanthomonas perforans]MEB2158981.1 ATPase, T2SS/T4P/T4SS family [Xanthomonas campestris pv. campestris]
MSAVLIDDQTKPVVPKVAAPATAIRSDVTATARPYHIALSDSSLEPDARTKDMLCLLEDGTLLLREGQGIALDAGVLTYKEFVRSKGIKFIEKRVALDVIQSAWARGGKAQRGVGGVAELEMRQREMLAAILQAKTVNASDIHFKYNDQIGRQWLRINGMLEEQPSVVGRVMSEQVSALYSTMAQGRSHPTFLRQEVQDATLSPEFLSESGLYGARIATRPLAHNSQLVVLRLLYNSDKRPTTMRELNYLPEQLAYFDRMTEATEGMYLMVGPTGSGKSTALAVACTEMTTKFGGKLNGITIEDPVEYEIHGWHQSPVELHQETRRALWPSAIRSLVRMDLDVAMVGEMRDAESMLGCAELSSAGHPVFSTLHANGSVGALQRIKDKGVSRDVYGNHELLRGICAQKLAPTNCTHCRIPWAQRAHGPTIYSDQQVQRIEHYVKDTSGVFVRGHGCSKCREGVAGRTPIAETIEPNARFMELFVEKGTAAAAQYWIKEMGGITRAMHLAIAIGNGLIDPMMGERNCQRLDFDKGLL